MRETLAYTQTVILKAVVRAEQRLDDGRDISPSETAARLARVFGTEADKLLAFTGRPTNPSSNRSAEEIVRALQARGLLVAPQQPPVLTIEGAEAAPAAG
jgi:hypothetical protein